MHAEPLVGMTDRRVPGLTSHDLRSPAAVMDLAHHLGNANAAAPVAAVQIVQR